MRRIKHIVFFLMLVGAYRTSPTGWLLILPWLERARNGWWGVDDRPVILLVDFVGA